MTLGEVLKGVIRQQDQEGRSITLGASFLQVQVVQHWPYTFFLRCQAS
jgi:hypothetical protein